MRMSSSPSTKARRDVVPLLLSSSAACAAALLCAGIAGAQTPPVPDQSERARWGDATQPTHATGAAPNGAARGQLGYTGTWPPSGTTAPTDPTYGAYPPGGNAGNAGNVGNVGNAGNAQPPGAEAPAAPPPEAKPSWAVDLAVVTEFPLMVGGQLSVELPGRILLQGEGGVLPSAYVNTLDNALMSARAYSATTSTIVRSALANSLVARATAGWRPFTDHGFEITGGYTLLSLGGGVSAKAAVEALTGAALPSEIADVDVPVHSTIHCFHVALGWRWVIADHVVIRLNASYVQGVASSSSVELPSGVAASPAVAAKLATANQLIDTKLNDIYTSYLKMPVVGLSLGYRF